MLISYIVFGCLNCHPELQANIANPDFVSLLGIIMSQFMIIGGVVSTLERFK
jgi:hypothetical protein